MLVAVTSEGYDLSSQLAERFTRSPFIIFKNTEDESFESLRNPYSEICGGAGIQTAQLVIEKNANAVIACEIGLNSFRLLQSAKVKIYSCAKIKIEDALTEFRSGKLQELINLSKDDEYLIRNSA